MKKPTILISNDDGIFAPGIFALWEAMSEIGHVIVVAPSVEKSAVGHAITVSNPLRIEEVKRKNGFTGFAVDGTPADCIKIAVKALMHRKPDLVISGINRGSNTGSNIIYSGTISAATEGTMLSIPSVAISLNSFEFADYSGSKYAAKIAAKNVLKHGMEKKTLLNVNVPAIPKNEIKGFKITTQGNVAYEDRFEKREDPRGKVYYWMTGEMIDPDTSEDKDQFAVSKGFVSITPIHYRLTNHKFLDELNTWDFQ